MKMRIVILFLVIASILLVGCGGEPWARVNISTPDESYFESEHIENSNLTRIIDPEFGVVCYWFAASGVSSTLSCVKALGE